MVFGSRRGKSRLEGGILGEGLKGMVWKEMRLNVLSILLT